MHDFYRLLGQRSRTTQVVKLRLHHTSKEAQSLNRRCDNAVEHAGNALRRKLVEQTADGSRLDIRRNRSVPDQLSPVDGCICAVADAAAEGNWVEQVHGEDLLCHISVAVRCLAVRPVIGQALVDEERCDGVVVWNVVLRA